MSGKSMSHLDHLGRLGRRSAFWLKGLFIVAGALGLTLASPALANDLPTGGVVTSGGAVISQTGLAMDVTQSTNKAVINWQSFDIGSGASVNFKLPDSSSITLNRVTGDDPSKIFGSLTSNGQIFLLNPHGVLFGATSRINAAGIVASTMSLSDEDFNAGRYVFKNNGSDGSVINEGEIVVTGYAAFLAPTVRNEAIISGRMGTIALAGGNQLTLNLTGTDLLSVQVDPSLVGQLIENHGMIAAQDGQVIMTLSSERKLVDSAIASKLEQAQAIIASGDGKVSRIVAGGQIEAASIKIDGSVTGRVDAIGSVSAQDPTGLGGQIDITAGDVSIASTARLDASGSSGGGAINIGGGFQGADPDIVNARTTSVDAGASITADAGHAGDGGTVVIWSDKATHFAGSISARGGADAGQGGFVEVSGKKLLDFTGAVNLRAPMGRAGTLLLDPYNLTIASTGGNIAGTDATMDDSVLTVSALQSALDAGNVLVTTGSSGSQSGNITVAAAISWLSENTLTLRAANDIAINANILGLTGSLVLQAGQSPDGTATSAGSISLLTGKSVRMLTGSLTASAVNNISFIGSVQSQTASTLTAGGSITASNTANVFSSGVAVTSGAAGAITLKGTGNTELKAVSAGSGGIAIDIAGSITSTANFISAGAVSITTSTGSDGNIDLTGAFSSTGLVTLSADKPGFIRISNITNDTTFSSISGGGAITLTSATKTITLGSTTQAITGVGGDAGQASGLVSISAAAVNIAKSIVTAGGNISITSTTGAVTASAGANITTTADANTGTTSGSVTIAGASGVTLNNVTTTGASNNLASGSNAATVNISSSGGNVSVYAITTSGGEPLRKDASNVGLDNGGNAASITLTTSGANKSILRGNLTAIGGIFSGTSTAAQGLGGNILSNGAVTLADHITLDTGATTGYVFLLGTVDSESSSALKALNITAGAGNVRFGGAIGQTTALYSLDVNSAVTTDIFSSIKTDGSVTLSGRTTGIRIATTTKLNFGNLTTESNNTPVVIDTSGGNGVFTLNNSVYTTIVSEMHAPVVFTRGTGQVYVNSTLYSTTGEYNNLTFNTASGTGGAVTVVSTIGGGTQGSTSGLGDISLSSVSNLSFQASIAAKSLVSLGGTGTITLATNSGAFQYYNGANGYQLSSSSASALSINMNATLTQSGAPVSVSTTAANVGLTISGTTTTAGGAVTISTKGALSATQNNSSILTNNGAITLTGLGGINNQSYYSTSVYNAGSGKIRMYGGGNTITQYALLSSTDADTNGTPAVLVTDAGAVNLFTVNANANNLGVGTLQVGIVASDTAVAPAQSVGAGGSLNLLASGLRLRTSQALKLKFVGDETTNSFVITGTDASGNAQSETVSGASATSVTSTKSYKTITSVVASNATAANVSVGLAVSDTISGALSQPNNPANETGKIDIANLTVSSASSISITSTNNKIDTLANFDVGSSLTVKAVGHTAGMALTGNVMATSVDIGTGNGALILGNYSITATSGNATLTGYGITQGASSTVTASGQVYLYGYDYNNGNNRGVIDFKGNIVAGNTSTNSVMVHGFTNAFLGNITAGTLASRGGMVIGDDSYYCLASGCNYWNWFTGTISQNVGTTIKVGQLYMRARDASAGSGAITLTNPNNEFGSVNRILRYGAFSLFDADTEANNLQLTSSLYEGSNTSAIRIKTMGSLTVGGIDLQGYGVILEGTSITSSANIWSGNGDLILRPNGGNVTLTGTQRSNSSVGTYYIQNSNNIQLGYTYDLAKLQFGFDAVTAAVSASQSVAAQGGAITINGTAATSSVATSSTGNRIIITSAADDSARTFTVTGTDLFGRTLTETITGANAAAASGSKYFATVTSVSAGAGGSSSVAVGWATESVAGNVTQQNDVDLSTLSGKVAGSITLDRSANSFSSVTNLTAGGAISSMASGRRPTTISPGPGWCLRGSRRIRASSRMNSPASWASSRRSKARRRSPTPPTSPRSKSSSPMPASRSTRPVPIRQPGRPPTLS
ncbi:MAG: filamentous hemagglutinin N-terminal domain-containing protein, partial [Sphingomonadaceae bacterium]|nr:filamentous hemagglutinin N-terminal domain-containing protein [Sphingomonadaceae bacterium]